MELARLRLTKAGEHADGFHRGKASHEATHRAENALGRAIIAVIGVVCVADKAAITGRIRHPAREGTDLAVELANCGAYQRDFGGKAKVIDGKTRREIITAVDNHIDAGQDFGSCAAIDPLLDGMEFYIGIKSGNREANGTYLGLADLRVAIQHLPLQVGQRHDVIVNNANCLNTRRSKILDRRTSNPARADQQDMAVEQFGLTSPTYIAQHNMACIAVELLVIKGQRQAFANW